jgi:hypothetical protein
MSVTTQYRDRLVARDGFVCHYCGHSLEGVDYAADHIVPRSKGGKNHADNLVLACKRCNSRKNDRPYLEFKAWADAHPQPPPAPAAPKRAIPHTATLVCREPRPILIGEDVIDRAADMGLWRLGLYVVLLRLAGTGQSADPAAIAARLNADVALIKQGYETLIQQGLLRLDADGYALGPFSVETAVLA